MQIYLQLKQQRSSQAFKKIIINRDNHFLEQHKELLSADNLEQSSQPLFSYLPLGKFQK